MSETKTRILSGLVYVVLLIGSILLGEIYFGLLFGLLLLVGVYEYARMTRISIPIVFLLMAIIFAFWFRTDISIKYIAYITVLFLFYLTYKLFAFKPILNYLISKYLVLLFYIISSFVLIVFTPYDKKGLYTPSIIISIFILIWTNDSFAYLVGRKYGKRKLLEKISPKKTVEGFIGGMVFCIFGAILIAVYNGFEVLVWGIIAVFVCVGSTIGDLIESKLKRESGVKDSGSIMPGHGGILDRLDSIIYVIPFVYLILHLV